MPSSQGRFVWYELMTTDLPAATAFYRAVLGWTVADSGTPGMNYQLISAGETQIGGMMELPQPVRNAGGRPGWTGYIGVDDVDAVAARITQAGGGVHHGPADIPGIGRFAAVADPQGAMFTLFRGAEPGMAPPLAVGATPGRVGWHELHAGEQEAAFAFYAGLFGWSKAEAIDMGPIGTYQIFAIGGVPAGGMMTRGKDMPPPSWLYYVNVDDINAAVDRAKQAGGNLLNGPLEVPGGSWIAHCGDPQGAVFAMVKPGEPRP